MPRAHSLLPRGSAGGWGTTKDDGNHETASVAKTVPTRATIAFHHFPKSGGTSVKNRLIEDSKLEHSRMPGLITGVVRTTAERRLDIINNSSVIMGYVEMLRLPLEDAGRKCDFFTMVRHPIDRLVSAFYFCPADKAIPDNRPEKWCGDADNQKETLHARLVEFSRERWGNTAFRLMMHSFVCDPRFELCRPELMLMKDSVEAFTTFMEASMEAIDAVEASIEYVEDMKASTEITSTGASTKASMEDFMEVMEAFAEVMEAFMEVTSTEFFMKASVEASMEDMKDMNASTEVTSTGSSAKASMPRNSS
eukprot:jgi/Undpi1/378/HiC_scaffold_1.g00374.m1